MFAFSENMCYTDFAEHLFLKFYRAKPYGNEVIFMKPLSENQHLILEYLKERMGDGVPPSVREICQAVGLRSTSSVQANLDALEEKGYIVRDPMLKRSIRIVGQAENVRHVPLLGTVTAGLPILAVEQVECYLPFTGGHLSKDKELFALRVRGEGWR